LSEGELYKKAVALSDRVADKQGETYDAVVLDVIADLIDEAKKDLYDTYAKVNEVFGTSQEEELKIYEKWFQKWFGDKE
jgi:hypothetical protein